MPPAGARNATVAERNPQLGSIVTWIRRNLALGHRVVAREHFISGSKKTSHPKDRQ